MELQTPIRYLLDTNVFSALSQPKPQHAVEFAFGKHAGELAAARRARTVHG